ncbi:hypothetical protein E4G67_02270 [Candidatus Bathyarchaeota archaeon]|nr:MAG: hypothetical protein E4G67_02270 [Candidatus Bathyarchaeota archaeon]
MSEAKKIRELILADLEDDKVEIQAANAVTGAQRVHKETSKQRVTLAGKQMDTEAKMAAIRSKSNSPTNGGG